VREICTLGSAWGDEFKKPRSLGEGTGAKASDNSEAPQRATASRLVSTIPRISSFSPAPRLDRIFSAVGKGDGLSDLAQNATSSSEHVVVQFGREREHRHEVSRLRLRFYPSVVYRW
jgi:hypothetical protein